MVKLKVKNAKTIDSTLHGTKKKTKKKSKQIDIESLPEEIPEDFSSEDDAVDSTCVTNNTSRETQRTNRKIAKENLQRTLFVGNLPQRISKNQLIRLFNQTLKKDPKSVAEDCRVQTVRFRGAIPVTGGTCKLALKRAAIHNEFAGVSQTRIAYVVLTSPVGIQAALSLNGLWIPNSATSTNNVSNEIDANHPGPAVSNDNSTGCHIRVDKVLVSRTKNSMDNCVFLGNLPFDVTEEEVYSALSTFGSINHVRLIRDRTTGAVKGFGFVHFTDPVSVSLAIRGSETVHIRARAVRIQQWDNQSSSKPNKKPVPKNRTKSSDTSEASSAEPRKKTWRKLDQIGQAKGITLPSNLTGLQRKKFLEKRLQKKMKRKLRREQQQKQHKSTEQSSKKGSTKLKAHKSKAGKKT